MILRPRAESRLIRLFMIVIQRTTPSRLSDKSGAITRINAYIFCCEVARPIPCHRAARMHIHDDGDVLGEQAVTRGALVEVQRPATAQHRNARHSDVDQRWIEFHSRAPGGRENPAPIRIAAGESGFYQRRSSDGFGDAPRRDFAFCAANFNFNYALRSFAVGDNLQRERTANLFECPDKRSMRCRAGFNARGASSTVSLK